MFQVPKKLLRCCNNSLKISKRNQTKPPSEIDMFINGKAIKVPPYFTVLQALRREGVTVPTFCYHDRLSVAGNCRMCLVQREGISKPLIACATHVMKDMRIRTNTPGTYIAQEGVLEFILANHPLDCPICDQGGECDLQDLSMRFGTDRSRFTDIHFTGKRAVEDKDLGPLVRTVMTRCIHCTRCIRFASQVCGLEVLGTTGRGCDMLVGTYVDKLFLSELSGNVIDLCPVGALTAIPYQFKARPWEVIRTNSIDVTDATGTNISINHRFDRVLRVLPRENSEVNQEWLSDKGRWAIDSLEIQRLVTPMIRSENSLKAVEWKSALQLAGKMIKKCSPENLMAVAGPYCNVETLVAAKDLLNYLGSENTYTERGIFYSYSGSDLRCTYSLNVNMKDIPTADKILLVGTNPRFEAPILNVWIRQAYVNSDCDIFYIGDNCDFNYYVNNLGKDLTALDNLGDFMSAKKPLIFIGISQLDTADAALLMCKVNHTVTKFKNVKDPSWGIINIVTQEASWAGALEAGWKPGALDVLQQCKLSVLISLGADDVFYKCTPPGCFIIYIGFQGDQGAAVANMVLPGCAYTESGGVYLNMECRSQRALPAVTPPGKARQDWKIIRALAEYAGVSLPYSDAASMENRMSQISPNFANLNIYQDKLFRDLVPPTVCGETATCPAPGAFLVKMRTLEDYYCSDIFTCNSPTMVRAKKAAYELNKSTYAAI